MEEKYTLFKRAKAEYEAAEKDVYSVKQIVQHVANRLSSGNTPLLDDAPQKLPGRFYKNQWPSAERLNEVVARRQRALDSYRASWENLEPEDKAVVPNPFENGSVFVQD